MFSFLGRIAQGYSTTFIEGGEPLLGEIADMMRESNEEVPETLKSALDGNGGGAASFGQPQSFVSHMPSANSVPVSGGATTAAAVPVGEAVDGDW